MGGPLEPKEREILEAKRRIKYKYARRHMDDEPEDEKELLNEVSRIIREEMSEEELENLREDMELEVSMIQNYYESKESED